LASLPPRDQAKVLRGVIERFPPDEPGAPTTRHTAHTEIVAMTAPLESGPLVSDRTPQITREVVLRAVADAERLIQTSGRRAPWTGFTEVDHSRFRIK
jgi:hypothetical protein